jgi:hypothetical protein
MVVAHSHFVFSTLTFAEIRGACDPVRESKDKRTKYFKPDPHSVH